MGGADEEKQTSLYNPSVASLLSKFTAPEVAALQVDQGDESSALMARLSDELRQSLSYLRAHRDRGDLHRNEALEGASRRCVEVAGHLDELRPDGHAEGAEAHESSLARKEFVSIYFELKRLVDRCREQDAAATSSADARKIPAKPTLKPK